MATASGQLHVPPAAPSPGAGANTNGNGNGNGNGIGIGIGIGHASGNGNSINGASRVHNSASPVILSASASPAMQPLNVNSKSKSPPSHIVSDLAATKPNHAAQGSGNSGTNQVGQGSTGSVLSPSMSVQPNVKSAPTAARAPAVTLATGFPSPGREQVHADRKFVDDRLKLSLGMRDARPEAVRRCVRDNWEMCLTGSDFHQAFVLNASIHHASPPAIKRGMRDFGKGLIAAAKRQIIEQMTTADLDQVKDLIFSRASVNFFDEAFETRLKTIESRKLINALARAERLGYEPEDVEDDDNSKRPQPQAAAVASPVPMITPASARTSVATPQLHCDICFRRFPAKSAFDHHVRSKVCTRVPPTPGGFKYNCQHCGQGFTTPMGLQYHNANHVCGDFGEQVTSSAINPINQLNTPVAVPSLPSRPAAMQQLTPSTPSQPAAGAGAPRGTPGLTDATGAVSDPYKHLAPESLAALQSELREAEIVFAERFRQANLISDIAERKTKVDGLGNSFATKQSMIRKKYGVRLRSRRNRNEIDQERARMNYKTSAELQADMIGTAGGGKQKAQALSAAAMQGSKRRFSGSGSGSNSPAPAKRVAGDVALRLGAVGAGTKEEPMALDGSSSEESGSGSNASDGDEDIPAVLPPSMMQTLQSGSAGASRPGSSSAAVNSS